jgi:hypothetical protein
MDIFILDMGTDVRILPKKYWDLMGKTSLVWSPIQLRIANQYIIYPIIILEQVEVNIEGVNSYTFHTDFYVETQLGENHRYYLLYII